MTCAGQYKDAVRMTVDQMDVIKKFVARYPDTFTFVTFDTFYLRNIVMLQPILIRCEML